MMKLKKTAGMIAAFGMVAAPVFAGSGMLVALGDGSVRGLRDGVEIQSWSFSRANTYAGQTTVNAGVLNLTANSMPPAVAQLCQSHAPIPSLTIEGDGQRREFRNVVFKDCPAGGAGGTYTLTVGAPPAPASATAVAEKLGEEPNVMISGVARMRTANNLKQMGIAIHNNTATLYVGSANGGVWKTTDGGQALPEVVIEGKVGTKITFTNVTVIEVAPVGKGKKVTIQFAKTNATPQLVEALLAGR